MCTKRVAKQAHYETYKLKEILCTLSFICRNHKGGNERCMFNHKQHPIKTYKIVSDTSKVIYVFSTFAFPKCIHPVLPCVYTQFFCILHQLKGSHNIIQKVLFIWIALRFLWLLQIFSTVLVVPYVSKLLPSTGTSVLEYYCCFLSFTSPSISAMLESVFYHHSMVITISELGSWSPQRVIFFSLTLLPNMLNYRNTKQVLILHIY